MSAGRRRYDPSSIKARTESSIWDVYNNISDIRDDDLIKDWNDSLNFLLIFAAIFAAVLTALIVESMKLLQQDPQDASNAILIHISAQLANNTISAYQETTFEAPRYAVIVNILLFSSLCCSLAAALAGVIALQWVNEYDARLDTVDAQKQALIRHFRFLGVETWKMGGIIAILPLLLHASVFLFFAGLIGWARNLHDAVTQICVIGLIITSSFYAFTVILGALLGNAPFRSPMARALRFLLFGVGTQVIGVTSNLFYYLSQHYARNEHTTISRLYNKIRRIRNTIVTGLYMSRLENRITEDAPLNSRILSWIATNVEITQQSFHRLRYILEQATPLLIRNRDLPGPWYDILNQVAASCLQQFGTGSEASGSDVTLISNLASLRIAYRTSSYATSTALVWVWTPPEWVEWMSPEMSKVFRYSQWDAWTPYQKLVGPLDFEGTLTEQEMVAVVSLIQLNAFKIPNQSILGIASTALFDPQSGLSPQILGYAVSSLSIYVWTHNPGATYDRVLSALADLIDNWNRRPNVSPLRETEICLLSSALHSAAFHKNRGRRKYWASRHPFMDVSRLGVNCKSILAIHAGIARHYAEKVSCELSQDEPSQEQIQTHLRNLCRFLAYTPSNHPRDSDQVHRAKKVLANIPHFMDDRLSLEHARQLSFSALPSIIWVSNMSNIPGIHDYLALLLSTRKKFPAVPPVWRDWGDLGEIKTDSWITNPDLEWIETLRPDVHLIEILSAFDQLIAGGCSAQQHHVLVCLVVDDLSDNIGLKLQGYYDQERKQRITELCDPALRLLGTRAAAIPYVGTIPSDTENIWNSDAWLEAVGFWCKFYEECDASSDELLLSKLVSRPNSRERVLVTSASSQNQCLQDRLVGLLDGPS